MRKSIFFWSTRILSGVLAVTLIIAASTPRQSTFAATSTISVYGAGKTIIEGGTGGTTPVPVTTTVAFHANANGGDFECLALAPATAFGASSGNFSVNAMYVTGKVTSLQVEGRTAILVGTATVTGLGVGTNVPFEAQVLHGGPGTTVLLNVSGLTFHEILLEGNITVQPSARDEE
jgi:hypothetical protein